MSLVQICSQCLHLLAMGVAATSAPAQTVLDINVQGGRHAINPMIYGVAFGSTAQLSDLQSTLNRYGGNETSRYNWSLNAYSLDNDYYFESRAYTSAVAGEVVDTFISDSKAGGAQPFITVPMLSYMANLGAKRSSLVSFSVKKYGPQTMVDPWDTDAGNGVSTLLGNPYIVNDPLDANTPNDVANQTNWMKHVISKFGRPTSGGVKYYIMDNEPSIWNGTHRDIHPAGETYAEIISDYESYALMVRKSDPGALIVGPEEWGWGGYIWSGSDYTWFADHNWTGTPPDQAANGGLWHAPYILKMLAEYQKQTGYQLLNVFSLHYYPQQGEYGGDDSPVMQAIRNRSTRSLWDPGYTDPTWINAVVQLIPRMKNWVSTYYPGLATAITEYSWGDDAYLNGATTQADILGIFGREGLDMGSRFVCPSVGTPTYLAMKIYRNYDGAKSSFGDTSVTCAAPNADDLSGFASQRTKDSALTVMVVNKVATAAPIELNLSGFNAGKSATPYQINSATQTKIAKLAAESVVNGILSTSVPPQSITLFVIPQETPYTAQYTFESGTQGWVGSGSPISAVQTSSKQAFSGDRSLAVTWKGAGTASVMANKPATLAGKTVTFHVWVPAGSTITSVQPFVQQPAAGQNLITSTTVPVANIATNAWNTITVNVPPNAVTPLASLGVQFTTSAAWTGTCYIDAVGW